MPLHLPFIDFGETMHCHAHAIEVDHLDYHYEDGTPALCDVSFIISHGMRVALLGPNGAGKSTLIEHLNGIILAQEGRVLIEDVVISPDTLATVRERVGIVFQDPDNMLFMTSIAQDIAFGPLNLGLSDSEVEQRTSDALAAVSLSEKRDKPGMHLSFGQKKRAALATVLSMSPRVLVLDEPTSNLDPRAKRNMSELLANLDITLLVATHDMELAWNMCDTAIVLDEGKIVCMGDAHEIMSNETLMLEHGLEVPPSALRTH